MTHLTHRFARIIPFALIAILLAATAASAAPASDSWIHVRVEGGSDDEVVTVNLPLSLLSAAAQMIPDDVVNEIHNETQIAFDEAELSWEDLQNLWEEIRYSPDATYMTLKSHDQNLRLWKEGDFLRIGGDGGNQGGAEIDVSFPLAVVDALFSGPEGRLDIAAALQALADYGPGNLVSIRDGEQTVRVWIDNQNESE